jgi:transposase
MSDVIGLDLSLKHVQAAVVDEAGEVSEEARLKATPAALRRFLGGRERSLVVMEAGGTSAWVARSCEELGHEVVVANPRRLRLICESSLKTDRVDAVVLARLGRADRQLLSPVRTRSETTQRGRAQLRVRECLMQQRKASINVVLLRGFGHRFPTGPGDGFLRRFDRGKVPAELRAVVSPLLETIEYLTTQLKKADEQLAALAEHYPVVEHLQDVPGVGPLVSLSFVLCIEDPDRFRRARDVAGFLGLRPRLWRSGATMRRGRITKEGDPEMRRLLVQAAHVLLHRGRDCDLKRWGRALAQRSGTKKAVVAVARKLAVLLVVLWRDGVVYEAVREPAAVSTAA